MAINKLLVLSLMLSSTLAFAGNQAAPTSSTTNSSDPVQKVRSQEDAEKKAKLEQLRQEAELQRQKDMAINCQKATKYMKELQSKVRIRLTDASGQMKILSTEEKAQEVANTQEMIDKSCGMQSSGGSQSQ